MDFRSAERHLDRPINFSSDDPSSGYENYSWGYHNLEGHMQDLGLTSCQHYGMGYGYGQMPQPERSASTSQTSASAQYRSFGYYHPGADIAQPPPPYYSDDISSTQSSLPIGAQQHSSYYPYRFNFFIYRRNDYDDDFLSHRNSMWKRLYYAGIYECIL